MPNFHLHHLARVPRFPSHQSRFAHNPNPFEIFNSCLSHRYKRLRMPRLLSSFEAINPSRFWWQQYEISIEFELQWKYIVSEMSARTFGGTGNGPNALTPRTTIDLAPNFRNRWGLPDPDARSDLESTAWIFHIYTSHDRSSSGSGYHIHDDM